MDLIKSFRTCFLCKVKDRNLLYVPYHGIYGESGSNYAYHSDCLKKVACSPENYPNKIIDLAVEIVDEIKYWEKERQKRERKLEERKEYLQIECDEME